MKLEFLILSILIISSVAHGHRPSRSGGPLGTDLIRWQKEEQARIVKKQIDDGRVQSAATLRVLNELKTRNIVGVEIITAGANKLSVMSQWGHSMLRLVDDDDDPLNDIVVSFAAGLADNNTATLQNSRADTVDKIPAVAKIVTGFFTGGYPITVDALPLFEFVGKYVSDESRVLDRHIIPTTSEQRKKIIQTLFDFQSEKIKVQYYLLSQNCASLIRLLLSYVGLPYFALNHDIPTELEDYSRNALWAPYPTVEMVNLPAVTTELTKVISGTTQRLDIPQLRLSDVNGKLDPFDKLTLLRFYLLKSKYFKTEVQEYWSSVIRSKPGHPTLEDIYGTKVLPVEIYENNGLTLSNALGTTPEHCQKIASSISYRQALPMNVAAMAALKQYKFYYSSYCH